MARIDLLTDKKAAALKPKSKPFKTADGRGLFLLTAPSGLKSWRLKFRLDDKERLIALGTFPDIDCEEARIRRDAARKLVAKGIDPVEQRRVQRDTKREQARNTFKDWADKYHAHHAGSWSEAHKTDVRRLLDELIESIGDKPMASIDDDDVAKVIGKAERRGAKAVARDLRLYLRLTWRYYNQRNPKARLPDPSADHVFSSELDKVKHHAALPPHELGAKFLRPLRNSPIAPTIRLALKWLLLTACRSGELRGATWSEIDGKGHVWRIGSERMKQGKSHTVPLSPQAMTLLAELRPLTGESEFLFPSPFDPQAMLSEATLIGAIKAGLKLRGKMTAHGCRSCFSVWATENDFAPEVIEKCLAHSARSRDAVRDAYAHGAQLLEQRRKLMEAWGAFIEQAERGAKVIQLHGGRATQ